MPNREKNKFYLSCGKRALDLTLSVLLLIILSPILAVIALLVRVNLGSPLLFCQQRPGLNGNPFPLYKFRTMTNLRDSDGNLLPFDKRITPFGNFLRSTSLDELPELWNVLKGDMGLVGPRPLLMEYLPLYTPDQARRHEMCPGITGWAQIVGRNAISWEDKFSLDVWYVDNQSLRLDIKILFMTVWRVLRRTGITPQGQHKMPRFTGK